jgi:alcohol dehydrogenase class IV
MKEYFKWLGMPTTLRELGVKKESLEDLAWNAMFKGKRVLPDIVTVDKDLALITE